MEMDALAPVLHEGTMVIVKKMRQWDRVMGGSMWQDWKWAHDVAIVKLYDPATYSSFELITKLMHDYFRTLCHITTKARNIHGLAAYFDRECRAFRIAVEREVRVHAQSVCHDRIQEAVRRGGGENAKEWQYAIWVLWQAKGPPDSPIAHVEYL